MARSRRRAVENGGERPGGERHDGGILLAKVHPRGERTQLDLSVHGNDWSVLAPERSRVLAPGAHWVFDVVEQLPLARTRAP